MRLKDKVAIITGAGRNIGEDTAHLFAKEGAKVAVVDLDKSRGEAVASAIRAAKGEAHAFVADVAKEADTDQLVRDVTAKFGRVDILINNVAISDNKTMFDEGLVVRKKGRLKSLHWK